MTPMSSKHYKAKRWRPRWLAAREENETPWKVSAAMMASLTLPLAFGHFFELFDTAAAILLFFIELIACVCVVRIVTASCYLWTGKSPDYIENHRQEDKRRSQRELAIGFHETGSLGMGVL